MPGPDPEEIPVNSLDDSEIRDPKECLANLVSTGSSRAVAAYVRSLMGRDDVDLLCVLLQTPWSFRDVVVDAILPVLLNCVTIQPELASYSPEVRQQLVLWALNQQLRPGVMSFNSPYIVFVVSPLASEIFQDAIYAEFQWILKVVQRQDSNDRFITLPWFSAPLLEYLKANREIFTDSWGSGKYLLFWIMYQLVIRGICPGEMLLGLARDYGLMADDDETYRKSLTPDELRSYELIRPNFSSVENLEDYYPPEACHMISQILTGTESC